MARPLSSLVWRDFLGLFDGVAIEAQQGQAKTLENLYKRPGALVRRGGTSPLGAANLAPNQDLDGLAWYKIGSTERLVSPHNGRLYDWQGAAVVTNSTAKLTSGTETNGAWIDGRFIWGDGTLQNIRDNGTRADQVLTDTPATAATVALIAGPGITGTYTYYVTFLSADSKDSPTSPKSASVSPANQIVRLTNIPTCGAGQDCAGRRIWRNKNGGSAYYLVTTIADNVTTTYDDSTLDTALIDTLTTYLGANLQNRRFVPCRFLVTHQNRLVGGFSGHSEGDKQTIYISNYREPWYCPIIPDLNDPNQGTRIPLQGPGAGEITGLAGHGDKVAVFTATSVFLLITSDQLLDYVLVLFSNHGCVAHRTIRSTKDALIWASADGIYQAREGEGVTRISDDVKNTYLAISAADLAKAHAFVWDDKYFFCWPSGSIVFDLRFRIWTRNTAFNWRASTVTSFTGSQMERVYAAQNGVARVWQLETGATDNGSAIATVWESHDADMGLPYRDKRLHLVGVKWKLGSGTATAKLFRETGTTPIQTTTKDLSVQDVTGAEVAKLDQRTPEQARGEHFRSRVEYSGAAPEYQLLQVDWQWSYVT